jgi:Na+:H+ antiporter, NhaA family
MKPITLKPISVLRAFLASEAAGGLILMATAAFALFLANGAYASQYFETLHIKLGPLSVQHWINDALMAVFFLLVGLEVKREFVDGHLTSWADRRLPIIVALAGMVVPALVYLTLTGADHALARGWAIPAATDIAFAIAVLLLLGKRVPTSLKLLLTTVAVVDDMGAVAIIAIGYTQTINGVALLASLALLAAMIALNRAGVVKMRWYLLGFVALWIAVALSGVHATLAGVLTAAAVPIRLTPGAPDAVHSTLHRLEARLTRPVSFIVIPLFGLANAGVVLNGDTLVSPVSLAVAGGLFFGKQLGIFGAIWLMVKLKFAVLPRGATWPHVYGIALLCGIGFTMSLFIGDLAFQTPQARDAVKAGVLLGSLVAAIAGYCVLRLAPKSAHSPETLVANDANAESF